jgi:transposase
VVFNLRLRISGVDLTRINGIDTNSALKIIAEIGIDMSRWKSAKHFANLAGTVPRYQGQRRQGAQRQK